MISTNLTKNFGLIGIINLNFESKNLITSFPSEQIRLNYQSQKKEYQHIENRYKVKITLPFKLKQLHL